MIYTYRVTLTGIKGFFRVYKVNSFNSLYHFHRQMQADLEFAQDQQILFKALDCDGNVIGRYALIDLGNGTVDDVTIDQTVKQGVCTLVYFYDIAGKKSVTLTLEGQAEPGSVDSPTIVESKGPNPIEFENGYVAFEDLPKEHRRLPGESSVDDEDDDTDEDDGDDDEDGKEIYDEDE